MSLHWPEELRFLTYVVGQVWPDGDEDRMFAMAQAWLAAAEDLERQVLPAIQMAEGRALSGYESGAGRDRIAAALHQLQTGDHSVQQLVEDFRQVGTSTRNAATTLEATKLMTIFAVTMLAAQIAGAWLWPPTAPAVEAAAIGATRATLYRVSNRALAALGNIPHVGEYLVKTLRYLPRLTDEPGRIAGLVAKHPTAVTAKATPGLFKTFVDAGFRATTARTLAELPADTVQFLISKAVNNLIWAGGLDATIQGIQISKGHRDEFNATQFGMSVAASTGGWYAGALVATNLSKYGGRLLTSRGKDPTAGMWGAGLGLLSGTVPTVVSTLVGGGIAMGFTGSFDPTVGLIGALSSNSLIGTQRGYIGMRGQEPVATRAGDAAQHNTVRAGLGADAPAAGQGRRLPLESSNELISKIRARDDQGYQAARAQDRAAVREAERSPDSGPVDRRAHRDAFVNEQRSRIKEVADARRAVLDAELANVRARDRAAAAPDNPAAHDAVVRTRQRLDEAIDADAATRARVQSRLEAADRHSELAATTPPRSHPDREKPLPPLPEEKQLPPLPKPDSDNATNFAAERRDLPGDEPGKVRSQADSATSAGSRAQNSGGGSSAENQAQNPGVRTRVGDSEITPAWPTPAGHDRTRSTTDSTGNVPSRNDNEHSGGQQQPRPSPAQQAEDPTVATLRSSLAVADARINTLRDADTQVTGAYKRAVGRGLNDLVEQRTTHREALAGAKTAREAIKADLDRARTAHGDDAPDVQRQRIAELEKRLNAQDRTIEDEAAHLAVIDRQLTRTSSELDAAIGARERAMADVRRAMTDLEDAGRAAAAASAAYSAGQGRGGTTHPFAHEEQLRREIDQRRVEVELSRADHEELEQWSGVAERRLQRQLSDFETSIRTERTLLDGGYMSGKPKPRKLPLAHGMPDPFTALLPPTYDFWLPGGTSEHPAPEPEEPCEPEVSGDPPRTRRPR
ncbi:WXG100-like domain-containing protein [Nocardia xishanensis]